jgi:hypothetical protein
LTLRPNPKLLVIDEVDEDLGDYGYRHILCRLEG